MAKISGFGTAPERKAEGYFGIGTVTGTDQEVLSQFFSDSVCLVRGCESANEADRFDFFVMVKP